MTAKVKIAVSWAAACGGCDVSLLDIEEHLLALAEKADIVYWPVAMDFKREHLEALPDGSVDVGLFNGAIRTDEQAADARLFRRKCRVLVAYGACAHLGGIPGLGNLAPRDAILETAYETTASTDNPDGVLPQTSTPRGEGANGDAALELPAFEPWVRNLAQAVPVDLFLPGCPPPTERVLDLLDVVNDYVEMGAEALPPSGATLASDKALCDTCPRMSGREGGRMEAIHRPHEIEADPERCFLDQGLLCLGVTTRGGCGATCMAANQPCRGCFGPVPGVPDPGGAALSAFGSLAGAADENDVPAHVMMKAVRSSRDPAGTVYRFGLPDAFLPHVVEDKPGEKTS